LLREALIAITILVILIIIFAYLYGNDIIERPLLALLILFAWLGAFVGTKIHGG
jgi:uncharacterized membrane protein YfcA